MRTLNPRYNWKTSRVILQIFRLLAPKEKMTISDIALSLNKDISTISEQVKIMEKEGMVFVEKEGKTKNILINQIWAHKIIGEVFYEPKLYIAEDFRGIDELISKTKQKHKTKGMLKITQEMFNATKAGLLAIRREEVKDLRKLEEDIKKLEIEMRQEYITEIRKLTKENNELKKQIKLIHCSEKAK